MCTQSLALCLTYGDQLINTFLSWWEMAVNLTLSTISWIHRGDGWKSKLSPLLAHFCFEHVD